MRCRMRYYGVLVPISQCYPPVDGRLHTRYAPVRRSPTSNIAITLAAPRLACVKPAASVHPEPGSNSPLYKMFCSKSLALISKVLFEITLRREWENFSCSNTSKNAVRYIAIKNIFCFCRRVAPPGSVRCFRRAESGAKVKTFFETAKSFRKIFSENFSESFLKPSAKANVFGLCQGKKSCM